jgi:hypothetical protein
MSTEAIISMIVILTIVVGGFIYFLSRAINKERNINKLKLILLSRQYANTKNRILNRTKFH